MAPWIHELTVGRKRLTRTCRFLALLLLLAQLSTAWGMVVMLHVPGDYDSIAAAIADAPDHAIIEIATGAYRESLVIQRPLTLRAEAGAQVTLIAPTDESPVVAIADTDAVSIEGLTIVGGEYGIFVTRSQGITIQNNTVVDSRLAGIKVRLGAADIVKNSVINAQAPYGFGIHVTNTMAWPQSNVIDNIVYGNANGGIYTNMTSMISIVNNTVRQNGEYGIAVTEMSHADVLGNTGNTLSPTRLGSVSTSWTCPWRWYATMSFPIPEATLIHKVFATEPALPLTITPKRSCQATRSQAARLTVSVSCLVPSPICTKTKSETAWNNLYTWTIVSSKRGKAAKPTTEPGWHSIIDLTGTF